MKGTGYGAAFLIDGSRDFYLAHRPGQKLRGSPASFSLYLFLSVLVPSASLGLLASFVGPVPLPVEERSLEGRARRMQKRGKKRGSRERGGVKEEGGRDAQSRINAASLRPRSESRSEHNAAFSEQPVRDRSITEY